MSLPRSWLTHIEILESRIAPAVVVHNPLTDIVAGVGKTGATVDLSQLTATASSSAYHTIVTFTTNYDTDPATAGIQPGVITIELYDNLAPLTVQNFLHYVENTNPADDFTGTFFHRAITNFVLQGGGFQATDPTQHIAVAAPVHNEVDTANRSNVLGTIAMAKTPGDPNSATSEWFINLANNAHSVDPTTNVDNGLDVQNGGFTVFGKVTAGLNVAQAISQLPTIDVGDGGSVTPVQNYNSDPDHNAATPAPKPTVDQLITITKVQVTPPAAASTTGLTYTVQHIYQHGTTTPSTLVTGAVKGSTLNLQYTAGQSGVADVVVAVSDGTSMTTDMFSVDVRPDLIAKIDKDSLLAELVPGDSTTVNFHVFNTGAALAKGLANVTLSLAKLDATFDGSGNLTGLTLPSSYTTTKVATVTGVNLNIASGLSQALSAKVQLPTTLASSTEEFYQLIVTVTPTSGTAAGDRFTDDNVALNGANHQLVNEFGSFTGALGSRTNAVLKYTSTITGHPLVTWSMTGGGHGTIAPDGTTLVTTGTSLASKVAVTLPAGSGHLSMQGLEFDSALGTAALGSVNVTGLIVASAGLKALTLGNLTGPSLMLISPALPDNSAKLTLTLGSVKDFSIQSDEPIISLTAVQWLDTDSTKDSISAPSLGTLKITGIAGSSTVHGDFEADLDLTDAVPTTSISVAGFLRNSTIHTVANIGAITLGGIDASNVFAGTDDRPVSLSDFSTNVTIGTFTILGIKGVTSSLFTDSQVAAQTIGTIKVQKVDGTSTSGSDIGFVADVIKSYTRTGGATKTNVTTAQDFDRTGDYVVSVL